MIKILQRFMQQKVRLLTVLIIVVCAGIVLACTIIWGGQYIADAKYEADKQAWIAKLADADAKIKDYKDQFQQVLTIKERYRNSIKDIVEMLYNKDSHLAVGGTSVTVAETDEAVLLQIRNTVATMQDDQNLLAEVKNYLVARKEFIDNFPFVWPVDKTGVPKITSGFGFRDDLNGKAQLHMHAGIDIGGAKGDPVYTTADGVVINIDYSHPLYGKLIMIKHKYEFVTYYAHLNKILVKVGQEIKRGQKIGEMGNTGESEGYHLHYEIRRNEVPIDPMMFLNINY